MIRYLKEGVRVVVGRERQGGRREGEKKGGKKRKKEWNGNVSREKSSLQASD